MCSTSSCRPGAFVPDRIALVRQGDRPRLNARLADLLAGVYPECEVDDIDVLAGVGSDWRSAGRAAVTAAVEYALPLARRSMSPKRAVMASSGFARAARARVRSVVDPATHRFVFQSQSLFPANVPGVPHVVYTDHAHLANLQYAGFDPADLKSRAALRREIDLYRSSLVVFTRSRHVRDTIIHGYGIAADRVVDVGVGPNVPGRSEHDRPGWQGGRIVFVGVDWERKGGPELFEAFGAVRAKHPTARLEIVGCAPAIGGPGVTVQGRRSLDEVAELLRCSDVFCLPTRAEPFGVAFIEAMHAGLPVVGSDVGAAPDFVRPGQTGELVPVGDVAMLSATLIGLLDDPARCASMGAAARELALARYDWDVVMHRIRREIDERLEQSKDPVERRGMLR